MQQVIGILTDFDMYEEEEIEDFRRKVFVKISLVLFFFHYMRMRAE